MQTFPGARGHKSNNTKEEEFKNYRTYFPDKVWSEARTVFDQQYFLDVQWGKARCYQAGNKGPLVLCTHGAGYTGLTWTMVAAMLKDRCQVVAWDMRGHGESTSIDDTNLSIETLVSDTLALLTALQTQPRSARQPIAPQTNTPTTPIANTSSVQNTQTKRPVPTMATLNEASNLNSSCPLPKPPNIPKPPGATTSNIPQQPTANTTRPVHNAVDKAQGSQAELPTGTVCTGAQQQGVDGAGVASVEDVTCGQDGPSQNCGVILVGHSLGGAVSARAAASGDIQKLMGLVVVDVVEGTAIASLPHMDTLLTRRPASFSSISQAIAWAHQSGTCHNKHAAQTSIPSQLKHVNNRYVWKVDLFKTKPYWEGWYSGLSKAFLSVKVPKQLVLAGTDRMDNDLLIGQMQGQFQVVLLNDSGHAVQEDKGRAMGAALIEFVHNCAGNQEKIDRLNAMLAAKQQKSGSQNS